MTSTFAALLTAWIVAHPIGDFWVQTDHQASRKGLPGSEGRRPCLMHAGTYLATLMVLTLPVLAFPDVHVSVPGILAAYGITGLSHYAIDRRWTLKAVAVRLGKLGFHDVGAPRDGKDDNRQVGTGAFWLDQAAHGFFLYVAALVAVTL
jgi:hypothetical protein